MIITHSESEKKRMKFYVANVAGDGHCFYRCLYRIAVSNSDVAFKLSLLPSRKLSEGSRSISIEEEDTHVWKVRSKIASAFIPESYPSADNSDFELASNIVRNALETVEDNTEMGEAEKNGIIRETFPALYRTRHVTDFEERMDALYHVIAHTDTYASEIELSIARHMLSCENVRLFVVSQDSTKPAEENHESWIQTFKSIYRLMVAEKDREVNNDDENKHDPRMCILINADNVHYNVFKFQGSYVFSWESFYACISRYLSDDSDDSED